MKLPADIKRYIAKKVIFRLSVCFVLEAAAVAAIALWGGKLFASVNAGITALCYIVVLLIPFAITGVPFKLIDRTWCGVVEKVDVNTTYDYERRFRPTLEGTYLKNTIYLTVMPPDKEHLIIKKVYAGRAKLQQHINDYVKGDKVFHLYGTQHTIVLPVPPETHVQCAVCGTMNDLAENKDKKCHNCRLTLISDIK